MRSLSLALVHADVGSRWAAACLNDLTFAEEYRGTEEQRAACQPDVFRLCNDAIPVSDRIVACLNSHRQQLSPANRLLPKPSCHMIHQLT
jgi:hypothetical protein